MWDRWGPAAIFGKDKCHGVGSLLVLWLNSTQVGGGSACQRSNYCVKGFPDFQKHHRDIGPRQCVNSWMAQGVATCVPKGQTSTRESISSEGSARMSYLAKYMK